MQGIAQSLDDAALDLAMDRARIERAADVLDDAIAQHLDMSRLGVDGDLAIVDGEDGDVDRVDEMAGDAAGHRGHAGSCEGAGAGDRADLRLGAGRDLGDQAAGAGRSGDFDSPERMTRSSGAASIISEATFSSFVRTSCAADRLAAPSETVVRPPPTPTS